MLVVIINIGYVYLVYLLVWDKGWKFLLELVIIYILEVWMVNLLFYIGFIDLLEEVFFRIFLGGDDFKLCFGIVIWSFLDDYFIEIIFVVEVRGYDVGVIVILFFFVLEDGLELFVIGSYDENIRFFLLVLYGRFKNFVEMGFGGGVWRLKLINFDKILSLIYNWRVWILVLCMYVGLRVVDVL